MQKHTVDKAKLRVIGGRLLTRKGGRHTVPRNSVESHACVRKRDKQALRRVGAGPICLGERKEVLR